MPNNPEATPPIRLQIKVVPGAAQSSITGWLGDRLKLRVNAAAEKGKANAAVGALIAKTLGLHKTAVRVVAGQTTSCKTIEICGIAASTIEKILGRPEK
ncbi:MAG: DUF167 domain-containing protein [Gammaproteobacteria bacterium]|nr:DUF167 domain-containing protein [Gammaproteobacteria bacterium]